MAEKETVETLQKAEDNIADLLAEMNKNLQSIGGGEINTPPEESKIKLYLERIASSMAERRSERESIDAPSSEVTRELDVLADLPFLSGSNPMDEDSGGEKYFVSPAMGLRSATNYIAARSRRKQGATGLRSRQTTQQTKEPRTQINAEATWWNKIESSLAKEIDKASDEKTKNGLSLLRKILSRQESGKLGSKRTNAGSLTITATEADQILDAVMDVVDRQVNTSGSRGEIFAELLEKIASSAMSTFIEKTTPPIGKK